MKAERVGAGFGANRHTKAGAVRELYQAGN
jgi:hypothetical protein